MIRDKKGRVLGGGSYAGALSVMEPVWMTQFALLGGTITYKKKKKNHKNLFVYIFNYLCVCWGVTGGEWTIAVRKSGDSLQESLLSFDRAGPGDQT